MVRQDESFGVVPLCRPRGRWEVFLIKHRHGRYWGFPKGHAEAGETPQVTAARELKEETNLDVLRFLTGKTFMERYNFVIEGTRVFKRVYYFLAEVGGEVQLQKHEVSDGVWLPLDQALQRLTHPEGRMILSQVSAFLNSNRLK